MEALLALARTHLRHQPTVALQAVAALRVLVSWAARGPQGCSSLRMESWLMATFCIAWFTGWAGELVGRL